MSSVLAVGEVGWTFLDEGRHALGLILGGVYGIAASGLVLTYTTSGIFNFAHGALGMFCAALHKDLPKAKKAKIRAKREKAAA